MCANLSVRQDVDEDRAFGGKVVKPLPVEGHVPRDLLMPLRGKRVLVTGPNGFVGRWMLETLRHAGVGADIVTLSHGQWNFASHIPTFDYCVHCATDGDGIGSVCERAKRCNGRVLYLSSGAVYGVCKDLAGDRDVEVRRPFTEDDPFRPLGKYGEMKAKHELVCVDSGVATIARLFSFVGPGLRRHVGREFLEADPIKVKADGAVRSFMYAGDLARWLWTILLRGQVGRCYNVGSNEPIHVSEFGNVCGTVRKADIHQNHAVPQDGTYYVPDTSRAANELGLKCEVRLANAIERTLAWQSS
jgi:UDP-glucuronate decarboxylase